MAQNPRTTRSAARPRTGRARKRIQHRQQRHTLTFGTRLLAAAAIAVFVVGVVLWLGHDPGSGLGGDLGPAADANPEASDQASVETLANALERVVISEVAWMGTRASAFNEWIELHNMGDAPVTLDGWRLEARDGTPSMTLSGTLDGGGFFILERTDDTTLADVRADLIYTGGLANRGEHLRLLNEHGDVVDEVDGWKAGDIRTRATMARDLVLPDADIWYSSNSDYGSGQGSPGAPGQPPSIAGPAPPEPAPRAARQPPEQLRQFSEAPGAINVYFNKSVLTEYALPGNEANAHINLETRLLERLRGAQQRIDFATYEINLPGIVEVLLDKAADGVDVRVLADAKDATEPRYVERFRRVRIHLEQLMRGRDGTLGTADDIAIFAESPIMALENPEIRQANGLPRTPADLPRFQARVGEDVVRGHLLAAGEQRDTGRFYSHQSQMHNKFAIVDRRWVFTGSWNFTVTGLYGTEANRERGILGGNQQHVLEIHHRPLARAYEIEFNEMWGSANRLPNPGQANFSRRKIDNTPHEFRIDGRRVELYFSPGDNAIGRVVELVRDEADHRFYFTVFAWSDQNLVNTLKRKWEGNVSNLAGARTGFDIRGVFDRSFWNQWWSASVDMTGRVASRSSENNPNIRWANPAPVFWQNEDRKLHAKTLLIDPGTASNPTVVTGSTNWSINGNEHNDENMLIIYDEFLVNQYLQEFMARYRRAGGQTLASVEFHSGAGL